MADKGVRGSYRDTTGDLTDGGQHRLIDGFPTKLHEGNQGKHIPQHNNYAKDAGRSIFHGSLADAQELIDRLAGAGTPSGDKRERVDCGKIIGTYIDPTTKKHYPTTMATIRYSKKGAHIVPARPKEMK